MDPSDTFTELCTSVGLDVRLRKALSRLGYIRPTLVQSKCLPLAISSGRDLLVRARTGSGKTLAYCLPVLHKILSATPASNSADGGFVKALILVPTKELCTQLSKVLTSLTYYCDDVISHATLVAGGNASKAALAHQEATLRDRPSVLVSTPGGLLAHIRSGGSVLENTLRESVESLVVDEADLVLSFGYADDVTQIMKYLPKICQGFLMSATLSPELNSLKKVVLHSPAVLKLEEEDEDGHAGSKKDKKGSLTQFYLSLPKKDKNLVLYVFLKLGLLKGKGLFFTNTIDGGYRLKLFLEQFHIRSAVLNAELPLKSRLNIIEQFNVGNFDYLIATDESTDADASPTPTTKKQTDATTDDNASDGDDNSTTTTPPDPKTKKTKPTPQKSKKDHEYGVSRGLDFRGVSFVVNVDFPPTPDSYTHRIGRTARGGARGVALSLVDSNSLDQNVLLEAVRGSQPHLPLAGAGGKDAAWQATAVGEGEGEGTGGEYRLQPTPLEFDLGEIEGFRYRVEDVGRAVTRVAVRETRAAEIRAEILNSRRLEGYFESNASDLQLLRHDRRATHISKVQEHLKNVPKYLLPRGMQVAATRKRKRRRIRNRGGAAQGERRKDNDPLQSYEGGDIDLDGVADEEVGGDSTTVDGFDDPLGEADEGDDSNAKKKKDVSKMVLNTDDDALGTSSSGRDAWKQRHGKGKYNRKYKERQEQSDRYGS